MLRGHWTGRGGGRGVTGLLRAGGLCHIFVRSWVACVVPPLLWCVHCVPVAWPRHRQGGKPRGTLARLAGRPFPVSGAGTVTPGVRGGGFEAFVPPSPVRVAGLLRVPLAARPGIQSPLRRTSR